MRCACCGWLLAPPPASRTRRCIDQTILALRFPIRRRSVRIDGECEGRCTSRLNDGRRSDCDLGRRRATSTCDDHCIDGSGDCRWRNGE